jgi:hypothetical protein
MRITSDLSAARGKAALLCEIIHMEFEARCNLKGSCDGCQVFAPEILNSNFIFSADSSSELGDVKQNVWLNQGNADA